MYPENLAGIPDALIFFSLPFLVSRQEKEDIKARKEDRSQPDASHHSDQTQHIQNR